jgi:hypothetical protein
VAWATLLGMLPATLLATLLAVATLPQTVAR